MGRDYGGTLTSADRLYLDRLWQQLQVDPLSDIAEAIEQRLISSTLRGQLEMIRSRRREAGW